MVACDQPGYDLTMIKSLRASVTFITPIKTQSLAVNFQPQPGITAVVGRNGTGKSWSVIETPRYLLFGKKALRGAAADYKQMEAEGVFVFGGADYTIRRSAKREEITDAAGTVLAVGAEGVTAKVVELLGYGLQVFDLCNASVQKKTDMLGQMLPSARKKLVDDVVGLSVYETVEKACREEAKGFRREAEALTKALRAPGDEPPRAPEPPTQHLADLRALRRRHEALTSQLRPVVAPERPVTGDWSETAIAELEVHERTRLRADAERAALEKRAVPTPYTAEQLDAAEVRLRARNTIEARGPQPGITKETMEQGFAEHRALAAHTASEPVTCPECGTSFRPTGDAPPAPRLTMAQLRENEKRWRQWDGRDFMEALPDGIDLSYQKQCEARAALQAQADLDALPRPLPDKSERLAQMKRDQMAESLWATQQLAFERTRAANAEVQEQIDNLGTPVTQDEIDAIADEVSAATLAASVRAAWEREQAAFTAATAAIAEKVQLADDFKAGGDALGDARATLKAHLAPLLSRVASSLIFDMTAGELSSVVVDDDMEITVDGQRIETLSGAGETVANLALRIGLGQVLVAKAFPVFLGDEIDSDADDQRRAATKLALQSLRTRLSQIVLVSHRSIDIADHVLDLDNPQD